MSNEPPKPTTQDSGAWVFIPVIGVIVLIVVYNQANNQVRPPVPVLPSAPVIPQLPDLVAGLSKAKSSCEGAASHLKEIARKGKIRASDLNKAATLYGNAKAESDSSIDFLKTGLVRLFIKDDHAKIAAQMKEVGRTMTVFVSWADAKINPGNLGAGDPLAEAISLLLNWLNGVSKENEEAINQLRADLEACRLKEWKDIK